MSYTKNLAWLGIAACITIQLGQSTAFGQSKCLTAMVKDGSKVAAAKGSDITACIKNGGGLNCVETNSKKVQSAASKVSKDYDKLCAAAPPDFGLPPVATGVADWISGIASVEEKDLAVSLFEDFTTLEDPGAITTSSNKAGAKCQHTVAKGYEKALAAYNQDFADCAAFYLKEDVPYRGWACPLGSSI
jgi:hypothetical protein